MSDREWEQMELPLEDLPPKVEPKPKKVYKTLFAVALEQDGSWTVLGDLAEDIGMEHQATMLDIEDFVTATSKSLERQRLAAEIAAQLQANHQSVADIVGAALDERGIKRSPRKKA